MQIWHNHCFSFMIFDTNINQKVYFFFEDLKPQKNQGHKYFLFLYETQRNFNHIWFMPMKPNLKWNLQLIYVWCKIKIWNEIKRSINSASTKLVWAPVLIMKYSYVLLFLYRIRALLFLRTLFHFLFGLRFNSWPVSLDTMTHTMSNLNKYLFILLDFVCHFLA